MTEIINSFPGYEFVNGHNMFRGEDIGKGGWVYAEPGMYTNVALLDVGNMHGASILALNKLGEYTKNYKEIRDARMALKHRDYKALENMLDGKLMKYVSSDQDADDLQAALKLVLNSTYGIAAASFDNPLRDPRDENNIIALRGALFMRTLKDELIQLGYPGIHYKTDSVKIPNATPAVIQFVKEFGKKYGYEFEHECTYDRMCLVNNAVYIAKYDDQGIRNKGGKKANEWTATGAQFKQPYVFKRLFSKEPIEFEDLCETREVKTALYLDMNEGLPDVSKYEAEYDKLNKQVTDPKSKLNNIEDRNEFERELHKVTDRIHELKELIKTGHNYIFIGRTGQFCPMVDGCGAGILVRENGDKFDSAPNASGYKWMESEMVKALGKEDFINRRYFDGLCDDAIENISKYCDFEQFVNAEKLTVDPMSDWVNINSDELPF